MKAEHHVHLYGCLTPEDLWEIGKEKITRDRESLVPRLNWYQAEYEKACGVKPDWESYWKRSDGFLSLQKDFLLRESCTSFAEFQARFNLIIALCQVEPRSGLVVRKVFERFRDQGLRYAEARISIPPYISGEDISCYLETVTQVLRTLQEESGGRFEPRVAVSLSRDSYGEAMYEKIRAWVDAYPDLGTYISGLDICFYEENDPPKNRRSLVERIQRDNLACARPLAILYHVGETFKTLSVASSARWVWEVAQMGVTRIGHGVSLGIDPNTLKGRDLIESPHESLDHLKWLKKHKGWLREGGFDPSHLERRIQAVHASEPAKSSYDQEYLEEFSIFQKALMQNLKETADPVMECCPTSNMRLAGLSELKHHPIRRFTEQGLKVCIASDDPGIFDTTLENEWKIAKENVGLSQDVLEKLANQEMDYTSESLLVKKKGGDHSPPFL